MAATLNDDMVVLWTGLKSAIGSGDLADFEEHTSFREKYVSGITYPESPLDTGGGTHSHTSAGHTHTNGHTHVAVINTGPTTTIQANDPFGTLPNFMASGTHTHLDGETGSTDITTDSGGASTSATSSGDARPESRTAFFICPKTGLTPTIPPDAICWTDEFPVPNGFSIDSDWDDKFALGCASSDSSGGSNVGSATHNHGSAPAHTHTITGTHTHTGGHSGVVSGTHNKTAAFVTGASHGTHTHQLGTTSASSVADTGTAGTPDVTEATNNPEYLYLLAIENTGVANCPEGVVVIYIGDLVDLPEGWALMDGTDDTTDTTGLQVRGTNNSNLIGSPYPDEVEFVNDHTHTGCSHEHNDSVSSHSHTHTGPVRAGAAEFRSSSLPTVAVAERRHSHAVTINSRTPTWIDDGAADHNWNTSDGREPYIAAYFIKYVGIPEPPVVSINIIGNTRIIGNTTLAG